jgi:hypothetical protein
VTPEGKVEMAADRLMGEALGYTSIHFSQRRASAQTPGIPDRRYYKGRHAFWFEAKAPGKERDQSPYQKAFQVMCEVAGEDYVLGGIPELVTYLDRLGICRQLPSGAIVHDPKLRDPFPPTFSRTRTGGPTSLIGE